MCQKSFSLSRELSLPLLGSIPHNLLRPRELQVGALASTYWQNQHWQYDVKLHMVVNQHPPISTLQVPEQDC